MTLRRDRRRGQKKYLRAGKDVKLNFSICMNCGMPGAHFIPPSFGDKGFFVCKRQFIYGPPEENHE